MSVRPILPRKQALQANEAIAVKTGHRCQNGASVRRASARLHSLQQRLTQAFGWTRRIMS